MKFKETFLFSLITTIFIPAILFAATPYTGFVEQPIWFSVDTFTEGDTVSIFTVVVNGSDKTLIGTVEFFDGQVILGNRVISILPKSAKQISIDWKVSAGSHSISSRLLNAKSGSDATGYKALTVSDAEVASSKKITVTRKITPKETTPQSADIPVAEGESLVDKYLPESVAVLIDNATGNLEIFRSDTAVVLAGKKENAQEDLKKINEESKSITTSTTKDTTTQDALKKPLAMVSLFFFTLFDFIFKTKLVFYIALVFFGMIIIRYAFRLIRKKKEE